MITFNTFYQIMEAAFILFFKKTFFFNFLAKPEILHFTWNILQKRKNNWKKNKFSILKDYLLKLVLYKSKK